MLLDGDRIVGAALDRGIVGDKKHLTSRDTADAGHDAGGRRFVLIHVEGRERRQLEKRRPAIDQPVDPFANRQLALRAMPLQVLGAAALAGRRDSLAQLTDELPHAIAVGFERVVVGVDGRGKDLHPKGITSRNSRS